MEKQDTDFDRICQEMNAQTIDNLNKAIKRSAALTRNAMVYYSMTGLPNGDAVTAAYDSIQEMLDDLNRAICLPGLDMSTVLVAWNDFKPTMEQFLRQRDIIACQQLKASPLQASVRLAKRQSLSPMMRQQRTLSQSPVQMVS